MKGLIAILGMLCLFSGTVNAYVTDSPHNETNGVKCGSCHTYSLWWYYSSTGKKDPGYDQYTDAVCNSCHTTAGFPNKIGHTYTSMGVDMHNEANGDWTTKCIDCHDPHQQAQLDWLTEDPTLANDLFLVQGTIDNVQVDTQANQTTITYNPSLTLSTSGNWPLSDSASPDDLTWSQKNHTSERGLIFVHDTTNLTNTYSVAASDNTTIVLRGNPDTPINVDDSFGLIYGQFVKKNIDPPNSSTLRSVKFFDPLQVYTSGGFVEAGSASEGICQVCHTKTKYWLSNGTEVDTSRFAPPLTPPGDHNSLAPCTACHDTSLGFKPINADHTFVSSTGTTCANCHNSDEDIVLDTHRSRCDHCHTQPPFLIPNIPTASAGLWPSTPHNQGDCTNCHNADLNGRDIAGDFTNHGGAMSHTGQVNENVNCTDACHFHDNKSVVTQIHTGTLNAADRDPCIKCHQLAIITAGQYSADNATMTAKGTYSGPGTLIGLASAGPGDCTNCHTDKAQPVGNWQHHENSGSHTGQVTDDNSDLCSACHTINGGADPYVIGIHKNNCGNCHNGTTGALQGDAVNGPGGCVDCHGPDFYQHDINSAKFTYDHYNEGAVQEDAECVVCHVETNLVTGVHSVNLDPVTNEGLCGKCHNSDGSLRDIASGHFADPVTPNTCKTCHGDKAGHPYNTDHALKNIAVAENNCDDCHSGSITNVVHNGQCTLCHTAITTDAIANLTSGVIKGGGCVTCHSSINYARQSQLTNSFYSTIEPDELYGHPKATDHTDQLAGNDPDLINTTIPGSDPAVLSQSCATTECHTGTIDWMVHYPSGTCATCHSLTGGLQGSASTKGTGKPPVDSNYCTDCHTTTSYQDPAQHPLGI